MSTWWMSVLPFQPRGKCLVIATPAIPIGGTIQISLGNHSHLSTSNLLKHHSKPQILNSETEKEKREEIKGKRKGKSIEKDDYDLSIDEKSQRIVIKEEMMKKHMPPLFPQALYGKIIQSKSQVRDANFIWDPGKLNQDLIF